MTLADSASQQLEVASESVGELDSELGAITDAEPGRCSGDLVSISKIASTSRNPVELTVACL
ncbi:MAG: hypothetical protein KUG72_13470 [Pseudomonadales bacterium]|nr:hypothetical protein [Pseudomonadales bacterium]